MEFYKLLNWVGFGFSLGGAVFVVAYLLHHYWEEVHGDNHF